MLTAMRSADSLTESRARCAKRGRLHSAVAEQPADDRQAPAERQRPAGEAVPNVVDAHRMQSGLRADALPRPIDVGGLSVSASARETKEWL